MKVYEEIDACHGERKEKEPAFYVPHLTEPFGSRTAS